MIYRKMEMMMTMTLKVNIGSMRGRIMAGQMKIRIVKIFNDMQKMCGFVLNLRINKSSFLK